MWCLKRGYGVPFWLDIATAANKMLKICHSSVNVVLYLYLNSDELIQEWPVRAPNCLKFINNRTYHNPRSVSVLFGIFNLSTLMINSIRNDNQQEMINGQPQCQFKIRKAGTEYL